MLPVRSSVSPVQRERSRLLPLASSPKGAGTAARVDSDESGYDAGMKSLEDKFDGTGDVSPATGTGPLAILTRHGVERHNVLHPHSAISDDEAEADNDEEPRSPSPSPSATTDKGDEGPGAAAQTTDSSTAPRKVGDRHAMGRPPTAPRADRALSYFWGAEWPRSDAHTRGDFARHSKAGPRDLQG